MSSSRKYLFLFILLFGMSTWVWAQSAGLTQFNTDRLSLNKTAMLILGSWAIGNMLVNGFLLTRPASDVTRHFYKMNVFWNIVNLALAIPGFRYALITLPASLDLTDTLSEFYEMSQILLFNAGLDVAYITGGFLLLEMAKNRPLKHAIFRGYGKSLILQGGFLLVFDAVLVIILQTRRTKLYELIEGVATLGLVF